MGIEQRFMYNNVLINKFQNIGIKLESLGINEIAFDYDNIFNVLNWCEANGFVILGGDVFSFTNSVVSLTGDSWYYEPEKSDQDAAKSYAEAYAYISNYRKNNKLDYLFSVVLQQRKNLNDR